MDNTIGSDPKSMAGRPVEVGELLGQVFTPRQVALRMVDDLFRDRPTHPVTILDPAVGPGTFPSAMFEAHKLVRGDRLVLRDVDSRMIDQTMREVKSSAVAVDLKQEDYLAKSGGCYDFVIMNPPYVRQEWIDKKKYYRDYLKQRLGVEVPGTSNLYVYFVVKALAELKAGGRMVCIVYDSWLYTKFGRWLAGILKANCSEVQTAGVAQQPFEGRLIDATIITATRANGDFVSIPDEDLVPALVEPSPLSGVEGTKPIDALFHTKRGLRLKQAAFFLTNLHEADAVGATPFVKKPALIKGFAVPETHPEAALLQYPQDSPNPRLLAEVGRRLQIAQDAPEKNVAVLTWHAERQSSWYLHRPAPYAPLLFNYYLRSRPRHIYNEKRVYADNFYGLIPLRGVDPLLPLAILNSTVVCADILHRARNQGNGLKKIQLYEYRAVRIPDWENMPRSDQQRLSNLGGELVHAEVSAQDTIARIDEVISRALAITDDLQESANGALIDGTTRVTQRKER